jgi:hypothetical protein
MRHLIACSVVVVSGCAVNVDPVEEPETSNAMERVESTGQPLSSELPPPLPFPGESGGHGSGDRAMGGTVDSATILSTPACATPMLLPGHLLREPLTLILTLEVKAEARIAPLDQRKRK